LSPQAPASSSFSRKLTCIGGSAPHYDKYQFSQKKSSIFRNFLLFLQKFVIFGNLEKIAKKSTNREKIPAIIEDF
jgi:hypothetical protein